MIIGQQHVSLAIQETAPVIHPDVWQLSAYESNWLIEVGCHIPANSVHDYLAGLLATPLLCVIDAQHYSLGNA